ncbi:MAG: SDR family NAD(P)-dependent oxidoreductase [Burkholderiales bacterium]
MDIVITGGAGTIGQATAKILLSQGYRPVLFDIDRDRVMQVATVLGVRWAQVDLSISKSVESAFNDYGDNLCGVVP